MDLGSLNITIVEEQNTSTHELAAIEQLTQRPPVNLFQISVEAGNDKVFTNFERAVGTPQWRSRAVQCRPAGRS
jgi:hypothetical protein